MDSILFQYLIKDLNSYISLLPFPINVDIIGYKNRKTPSIPLLISMN